MRHECGPVGSVAFLHARPARACARTIVSLPSETGGRERAVRSSAPHGTRLPPMRACVRVPPMRACVCPPCVRACSRARVRVVTAIPGSWHPVRARRSHEGPAAATADGLARARARGAAHGVNDSTNASQALPRSKTSPLAGQAGQSAACTIVLLRGYPSEWCTGTSARDGGMLMLHNNNAIILL